VNALAAVPYVAVVDEHKSLWLQFQQQQVRAPRQLHERGTRLPFPVSDNVDEAVVCGGLASRRRYHVVTQRPLLSLTALRSATMHVP